MFDAGEDEDLVSFLERCFRRGRSHLALGTQNPGRMEQIGLETLSYRKFTYI